MLSSTIALAMASAGLVSAFTPNTPNTEANKMKVEGETIEITWESAEDYNNATIELMTGPNQDMIALDPVGGNVDCATTSSLQYKLPCVDQNSAIYFFRFCQNGEIKGETCSWTGRFAIPDKNGNTTEPAEPTQPEGEDIPWGEGKLVSCSGEEGEDGEDGEASPSPSSGGPPGHLAPSGGHTKKCKAHTSTQPENEIPTSSEHQTPTEESSTPSETTTEEQPINTGAGFVSSVHALALALVGASFLFLA